MVYPGFVVVTEGTPVLVNGYTPVSTDDCAATGILNVTRQFNCFIELWV
jgi:hypothetical protein